MTRLAGQDWLADPRLRRVFAALEAAGGADSARVVGGCVRNALMDRPIHDVDIATRLHPAAVVAAVEAAGLRAVPTGIAHGTVTVVSGGEGFEVTTLRRDVSTDGRNATVAFTDDWAEDAARRDFRLNALYADPEGVVFDPTGEGVADAAAGRIVFVGDAATRIREDYLRILRFFRFLAWYGRGEPDAAGLTACAALKDGMDRLSAERVSKELLKLLAPPAPAAAVRAMADAGVLTEILPEAGDLAAFEAMVGISDDPVLRLSVLLPAEASVVEAAARRLRLPNAMRERLVEAASAEVDPGMDERAARAAIYRAGAAVFRDRVRRAAAMGGDATAADRLIALSNHWAAPRMPVGGRELTKLGVEPGPEHGRLLKAFEDGWIADDFPAGGHTDRLRALIG